MRATEVLLGAKTSPTGGIMTLLICVGSARKVSTPPKETTSGMNISPSSLISKDSLEKLKETLVKIAARKWKTSTSGQAQKDLVQIRTQYVNHQNGERRKDRVNETLTALVNTLSGQQ